MIGSDPKPNKYTHFNDSADTQARFVCYYWYHF